MGQMYFPELDELVRRHNRTRPICVVGFACLQPRNRIRVCFVRLFICLFAYIVLNFIITTVPSSPIQMEIDRKQFFFLCSFCASVSTSTASPINLFCTHENSALRRLAATHNFGNDFILFGTEVGFYVFLCYIYHTLNAVLVCATCSETRIKRCMSRVNW